MTSTPHAAAAGFREPVTPQKRSTVLPPSADKADAALRAATLSFSPPYSRQSSSELSVSPPKTNSAALIAARAIGTGGPSPKPTRLNSPDRAGPGSLSRNSSFDVLTSPSTHAGSLKAAKLSVSRTSSVNSVSRAKTNGESGAHKTERSPQTEDGSSKRGLQVDGPPKPPPAKNPKDKGRTAVTVSPPSLVAAGLAVSRSTPVTPAVMASTTSQPERDQEPDILPPTGSVSEAKKRLLQQAVETESSPDTPPRGRQSLEGPTRSKHTGTFLDTPPQSTANISPLSAAKLAVQHSGRSAGASSSAPTPSPKPRQPSPIKREIKHDEASSSLVVVPPPKPAALKKPAVKSATSTKSSVSVSPAASVKRAPRPVALKVAPQATGTPPPQPIKPLPRKTRPPPRTPRSPVKDTLPMQNLDGPASKPADEPAPPKPTADEEAVKSPPPPPLPRGTKPLEPAATRPGVPTAEAAKPEDPKPEAAKPETAAPETSKVAQPVRRDPRLLGFTSSVKLPPPVTSQPVVEPVKQDSVTAGVYATGPTRQIPPALPAKPVEAPKPEPPLPVTRPKPEPPKPKTYVGSIVSRNPPSFYTHENGTASSTKLLALLPPPAAAPQRSTPPAKPARALRPNHTGPESGTRPALRPTPTWRDDLPASSPPQEDYLRPSQTGDSLRHALLASSLASSRAVSPVKPNLIPLPPPRSTPGMRTTMRSPEKPQERDISPQKKGHLLGKKHPNKHNEGSRMRWREFVTEKERKRYEGLWAANRGLHLTEKMFDGRPDAQGQKMHQDAVCALVVKDLWSRSRLPLDILQQIWELVDRGPRPKWWLTRDEFIMGLWLIDQSLKGRKLPGKVQDGTWESVRRMGIVLKRYEDLGLKEKKKGKR